MNYVQELVQMLQHSDPEQRREGALTLGDLGPAASAAVQELITALKDDDWELRWEAARALGRIGRAAVTAKDALTEVMLNDAHHNVRQIAEAALDQIQG
jgi:hypothetical protein